MKLELNGYAITTGKTDYIFGSDVNRTRITVKNTRTGKITWFYHYAGTFHECNLTHSGDLLNIVLDDICANTKRYDRIGNFCEELEASIYDGIERIENGEEEEA